MNQVEPATTELIIWQYLTDIFFRSIVVNRYICNKIVLVFFFSTLNGENNALLCLIGDFLFFHINFEFQ